MSFRSAVGKILRAQQPRAPRGEVLKRREDRVLRTAAQQRNGPASYDWSHEDAIDFPERLERCHGNLEGEDEQTMQWLLYHDEEWGVPCAQDSRIFEYIVLCNAQCGLSWRTIFERRAAYTKAFKEWNIDAIADMRTQDMEFLLHKESGIIRNRRKIEAAVHNAQVARSVQKECGSLAAYIWGLVPDSRPICNWHRSWSEVPATTSLSRSISVALKKRGFKFMGPTNTYAFMQTIGVVNDHLVTCFRHKEIREAHQHFVTPFENSRQEV